VPITGINSSVLCCRGYSPFGTQRPGATVKAFESAAHHGVCDGAILRAPLNVAHPENAIEPFSWGYRYGYAIRFASNDHPLAGGLLVGEDGPDEHGDDLCVFDPTGPNKCTAASLAQILAEDVPIRDVLAGPPQPITSPLGLEAADSSFTGIDFVPKSFVGGPVAPGAALYTLEGDFGFSPPNASEGAPEVGHEIKLINFDHMATNPSRSSWRDLRATSAGIRRLSVPAILRGSIDRRW
jgi:hypothetical protein